MDCITGTKCCNTCNVAVSCQGLVPFDGSVFHFKRTQFGAAFNFRQKVIRNSLAGMDFGYDGSGPADLALNILDNVLDNDSEKLTIASGRVSRRAMLHYHDYKKEIIERVDGEGVIRREDVIKWLEDRGVEVLRLRRGEAAAKGKEVVCRK